MCIERSLASYTYKSNEENKVGSWRYVEPFFNEKIAPCVFNCPVKQDINGIYTHLKINTSNDEVTGSELRTKALRTIFQFMVDKNPLLYATSSVCPAFCQQQCNRGYVDEALRIRETEKVIAIENIDVSLPVPDKNNSLNKRVAIIGGGPAGLSAAYQLARVNVTVEIFEREEQCGGLLTYGIPESRLDRTPLNQEISRIINSYDSISVNAGEEIDATKINKLQNDFDYTIIATGQPSPITIDNNDVLYGLDILWNYHKQIYTFPKNKKIAVLGSGNTAMDVAALAIEEGNKATIVCRESYENMTAHTLEIQHVESKGVEFYTDAEFIFFEKKSRSLTVKKNNQEEVLPFDEVIICYGQMNDSLSEIFASNEKVYIINKIGNPANSVAEAIEAGYRVANNILHKHGISLHLSEQKETVTKEMINIDYWKDHISQSFDPEDNLLQEADRCIQCGTCIKCGVCETFCADFAIHMKENENKVTFDFDYCKGCEICYEECPRGVISIREAKK